MDVAFVEAEGFEQLRNIVHALRLLVHTRLQRFTTLVFLVASQAGVAFDL